MEKSKDNGLCKLTCRFESFLVSSLIASCVVDDSIRGLRKNVNPDLVAYRCEPHITDLLLPWHASLATPRSSLSVAPLVFSSCFRFHGVWAAFRELVVGCAIRDPVTVLPLLSLAAYVDVELEDAEALE